MGGRAVNVAEEIRALRARGVTLSVDGERLKMTAPEPLPDELMDLLRTHKAEIMAAVGDQAAEVHDCLPPIHDARDPHATPSAPCAACGAVQWRAASHGWRWRWACGQCRPEVSAEEGASLPPVHDTDDPWTKPTAPCAACGQVRWRVWCHDERKVWQWLCNQCKPLVVVHKDGRRWRA
jgi:hypothetical protein